MNAQEFEKNFKLENFEKLEVAFQEAKKFFDNFHEKITFEEVKKRFPVVVDRNLILIMHPTYKIWVTDKEISYEEIIKLNKNIKLIYVDIETEVIDTSSGKRLYPISIHCMGKELVTNQLICSDVMELLDKNDIEYLRSVEIAFYDVYVDVDEKGNIVGVK